MTIADSQKQLLPFGSWPSSITARSLVAGVVGLSELDFAAGRLYWLESRPEEGGRTTLIVSADDQQRELTPRPYNVRSRVHEYGGGAYHASGEQVFFTNFADQNLYRVDHTGQIRQLTDSEPSTRFADFIHDPLRDRLISVVEQHQDGREADNCIAAIDLGSGATEVLASGHDFYAAPRLSPDGKRLSYIAWDHPNMPWDGTMLQVARVDELGALTDSITVAGGAAESVLQPSWQSDGGLLFFSDRNGYWNLHRFDASGIYCVLEDAADYADPPWALGVRNYAAIDAEHILLGRQGEDGQELALVNTRTTMATPITDPAFRWLRYGSPCAHDGMLHFIGSYRDRAPAIVRLNLADGEHQVLRHSGGPEPDPADVAHGRAISFPTRDGGRAHGYYYPPTSGACRGPASERPPLLVVSHGGPTAATSNSLSMRVQYYTNRGWAVLDVNYRGSTGFGREYRQALKGRWGELDVHDCEDGVENLIEQQLADPDRIAIRGGSAGGFTTLAALTSSTRFKAGASHYGIGDLNALARDTHKFESRYLNGLLDGPESMSARSPINHLDRFHCPVIFFQGSEDKVVPPNQSQSMANALRAKGIPVAYLEFAGEGHGFRDAENIIRVIEAEYGFFCRVFGINPAEDLPELDIDNAESL